MSEEELKSLLEQVKADTSLQEKLTAAVDASAVAAIAKGAGFSITAEDLVKAQSKLSDQELDGVACGYQLSQYNPANCEQGVGPIQLLLIDQVEKLP